ncbi:globin domain-containing protein [Actibacterium pelagium]|uniref:Globin domain-containing protein n=1 Tax=Actibacterium pelagium TaxID=2029103 RepID=A0A917AFW2_9RHOB|nr:globin domain-containing protein [Actibacterium pelagium]GGE49703.1 hypothetical protein GCM10011517_16860 [Actibacterium pelagium]
MTDVERKMIAQSLPVILRNKGRLRQSFFRHLFKAVPEAKDLFKRDAAHQGMMFERTLVDIFYACTQHGALAAHVDDFVGLHKRYHFEDRHFIACEDALVAMFADSMQGRDELEKDVQALLQTQVRHLVARFKQQYHLAAKAA